MYVIGISRSQNIYHYLAHSVCLNLSPSDVSVHMFSRYSTLSMSLWNLRVHFRSQHSQDSHLLFNQETWSPVLVSPSKWAIRDPTFLPLPTRTSTTFVDRKILSIDFTQECQSVDKNVIWHLHRSFRQPPSGLRILRKKLSSFHEQPASTPVQQTRLNQGPPDPDDTMVAFKLILSLLLVSSRFQWTNPWEISACTKYKFDVSMTFFRCMPFEINIFFCPYTWGISESEIKFNYKFG